MGDSHSICGNVNKERERNESKKLIATVPEENNDTMGANGP
jgi:hypothetical protein